MGLVTSKKKLVNPNKSVIASKHLKDALKIVVGRG